MSLYQIGLELRPRVLTKASLAPAPLIAFGLVILPMVAMVLLMFLLSSADPTTAVPDAVDHTAMLILPP